MKLKIAESLSDGDERIKVVGQETLFIESQKMVSVAVDENTSQTKEYLPDFIAPDKSSKDLIWKEPFAEVWRDQQWIRVAIVSGEESSKNKYRVKQIDGCTEPFMV